MGYRAETGAGAVVSSLGPIIELTGTDWLLSDFWLCTRTWPSYQITLNRLDELNWDEHLKYRSQVDIVGFRIAYDIAKEMIAAGHLTIPDYENRFTIRMT